jgi:hypothetical protein
MGISTLQSFKELKSLKLSASPMKLWTTASRTHHRIQGADFGLYYRDLGRFHDSAYYPAHATRNGDRQGDGQFHYRDGAEAHLNTPAAMW